MSHVIILYSIQFLYLFFDLIFWNPIFLLFENLSQLYTFQFYLSLKLSSHFLHKLLLFSPPFGQE